MARPSNTAERRAQIVQGLMTSMAERGYERSTIADIARAAGLSPGLVHYHFAAKRDVLVALVEQLGAQVRARFEERAPDRGARARLRAFLDAYVATGPGADPRAVACWVGIAAEAVRDPDVRALYAAQVQASLATLTELVKDALREADRATRDAPRIAAALLAAVEGSYQLATAAPGVLPKGFAAPALGALVDAAVEHAPGRKR